jgi:hypothetical protein
VLPVKVRRVSIMLRLSVNLPITNVIRDFRYMCYHTKSPTQAESRALVGNGVTVLSYPELGFANGFNKPELPGVAGSIDEAKV